MNYILFGDYSRNNLLPFTYTRPVADIRLGILTIREKWELFLGAKTSALTQEYLKELFPLVKGEDNILINASVLPNQVLVDEICRLLPNQTLVKDDLLIAHRVMAADIDHPEGIHSDAPEPAETRTDFIRLNNLWEIVTLNEAAIRDDFTLLTRGRKSLPPGKNVRIVGTDNVFIEEGAVLEMAFINASEGPVYIGRNAHVMDGAVLRGPMSLGQNSTIKLGAKIYCGTTIGPHCKVGGEVTSSVIFGYSNKAHDGFLGHSVIGEWCNLGAGTNTSNLKNNYSEVRLWNYAEKSFVSTGQMFIGLFMGDYSKCGINTMFNTGTVVGVGAQVFGPGYMRNFIPSFSFGGASGLGTIDIEKVIKTERITHSRRNQSLTREEENVIREVFRQSTAERHL
ncbi:MAG TPA: GlmU family protein [Bacteroidales bacterium]|nr:GlmU family protein [Bacteroidales bacterium]